MIARNFILGTDWWTDSDDVVALRLLCNMHKSKKINLQGIIINGCMEYSAASVSAFMCCEGLGHIPLALDRAATDFGMYRKEKYQIGLARLPHNITNETAEDPIRLYRRLLSEEKDKLDIIEIGYPQVLANLLKSEADEISPLCGKALVAEKVRKLWIMAGNYENEVGKENNFARNTRSREGGSYLCDNWPTEITFLGWEVGDSVITGNALDKDDIVYKAMAEISFTNGRSSWDPMLCLLAAIGDEEEAGYDTVRGMVSVNSQTGENRFIKNENGRHCYVVKKFPDKYYSEMINKLIVKIPHK